MNIVIAATVFALVLPAELPDKTALASLVLGARYRPLPVFLGAAAAFACHTALAVTAGSALALLPPRILDSVVAGLLIAGAWLLLRSRGHRQGDLDVAGRTASWRIGFTSFAVIVVAELGDLTQVLTASLAARYHDPLSVGAGSLLALWSVAALALIGGRNLLRVVPLALLTRLAALAMAALAALSIASAVGCMVG